MFERSESAVHGYCDCAALTRGEIQFEVPRPVAGQEGDSGAWLHAERHQRRAQPQSTVIGLCERAQLSGKADSWTRAVFIDGATHSHLDRTFGDGARVGHDRRLPMKAARGQKCDHFLQAYPRIQGNSKS